MAREAEQGVADKKSTYEFNIPGPVEVPFDHQDVRVYVDTMFLEGIFRPVEHELAQKLSATWAAVGVRINAEADRMRRLLGLVERVQGIIPRDGARYGEWIHFAMNWAELSALYHDPDTKVPKSVQKEIEDLESKADSTLLDWLTRRYAGLANLPALPPVMLHQIPRYLAGFLAADKTHKVALVVVDGLSLPQWTVVRDGLLEQESNLQFQENAVYAWVPTITSVSRQAVLAGKPPAFFPDSIFRTDKEKVLWSQFWADQGLGTQEVAYLKGLGEKEGQEIEDLLIQFGIKVAALIVDDIDRIMHGIALGASGMLNQVRQWAQQPYLTNILDKLLERGFHVFLTSDHGNVEAVGFGRPSEGAIADSRGQRARVYPDRLLRKMVKDRFPDSLEWDPVGLPGDFLPLLAPRGKAFVTEGERVVSHGGASVEELIVPFVEIERKH